MNNQKAIEWMNKIRDENPNILFRGQNCDYENIANPSVFRESDIKKRAIFHLCSEFKRYTSGITGYPIKNKYDKLALVQHYFEVSPVLDLTATPEIALYFSLLNSDKVDKPQVIYAFDSTILEKQNLIITDHSFLLLPLTENGQNCRWIRQDGFSVCKKDLSNFNILEFLYDKFEFSANEMDREFLSKNKNLLSTENDSVYNDISHLLIKLIEELDYSILLKKELERLNSNYKPTVKMKLSELKVLAEKNELENHLEKIIELQKRFEIGTWGTEWDAELQFVENNIKNNLKK